MGYSPKEIAVKEVKEETGPDVVPVRLLAVYDKKRHDHPPALHYAYKVCILCKVTGGQPEKAFDIFDCLLTVRRLVVWRRVVAVLADLVYALFVRFNEIKRHHTHVAVLDGR